MALGRDRAAHVKAMSQNLATGSPSISEHAMAINLVILERETDARAALIALVWDALHEAGIPATAANPESFQ